jgi:hypothetical protein
MKNLIAFFIFAIMSLIIGLGSARSMIDGGFSLITRSGGPWKAWVNAGSEFADPYTKAHFARSGELPITSASGLTFTATTDNDGYRLTSDCEYEIIARPLTALWWSIAVFDEEGQLIPNPAERYAFSNQNLTILLDGTQRISLAPTARPGHWLPSGEDHYLTLQLRIIRPLTIEQQQNIDSIGAENLPHIQRVKC